MNNVALIGRRTADPNGADFVDIVCFDKLAATCGEYLHQGP